jgi:hypothetical protein
MARLFKEPQCRDCNQPLVGVGSFWYCAEADCDSYCKPRDDDGQPAKIDTQADGYSPSKDFEARMLAGGTLHDGVTAVNE